MPRDPKLILNRIVTLCLVRNPRQAKPLISQEPMGKIRTLVGQGEILDLGKQGRRRRGRQRMRRLESINSTDMSLSKLWEIVKDREVHGVTKSWTQLSN